MIEEYFQNIYMYIEEDNFIISLLSVFKSSEVGILYQLERLKSK